MNFHQGNETLNQYVRRLFDNTSKRNNNEYYDKHLFNHLVAQSLSASLNSITPVWPKHSPFFFYYDVICKIFDLDL